VGAVAKKVIRTLNSDGTWSEATEQKSHGCLTVIGWVFGIVFVVAIAIRYPWMWALYVALFAIVIYNKYKGQKEAK
jgi:hypothetical protein